MNYYRSRRRRFNYYMRFFPSRRLTVSKVAVFLVSLVCLCVFYLSAVSPDLRPKGFISSLKLRDGSGLTGRKNISTLTPGRKTNCLMNKRRSVNFNNVGWTNFSLIMPHVEPNISCDERKLFIVVVVNSAADERHRNLRMAIRKTWGNSSERQVNYKWRIYYALGVSSNFAMNLKNRQEALEYNDIIIGNFSDTYKNVVIKTFMSHFWVYSRFDSVYVLKTDDDVYVRVSRLSKWLEEQGFPHPFYGGFLNQFPIVFRDPRSQWYVSKEDFNETRWPPFSHGAFQVVSTAILPRCFNYTQFRRPFTTDDAYFGVMARDLKINATNIPGFRLSSPKTDCELMIATGFGHALDASAMFKYHSRYQQLRYDLMM